MDDQSLLTYEAGPVRFALTDSLQRRHGDKTQTIALADVVRVRAGVLGKTGILEVTARDGGKLLVTSEEEATAEVQASYRRFVEALHRKLVATGTAIEYVGGLKIGPIIGAVASAGIVALAALDPIGLDGTRRTVLYVVGGLGILGGIVLALRNRRRFYDPLAIPRHLLP